uniref:Anoctamin dimerisation domain-containing protein n=1 Tax=Romanomermis culicivorax TaxID=13658 RepID=A0A915HIV9_ROMCU
MNIDYVLVFGVSSHEKQEEKLREYRRIFEKLMRSEGLILSYEMCKELNFVKISCPFDRLAKEAELMRLEMPLKNVSSFYTFTRPRLDRSSIKFGIEIF